MRDEYYLGTSSDLIIAEIVGDFYAMRILEMKKFPQSRQLFIYWIERFGPYQIHTLMKVHMDWNVRFK